MELDVGCERDPLPLGPARRWRRGLLLRLRRGRVGKAKEARLEKEVLREGLSLDRHLGRDTGPTGEDAPDVLERRGRLRRAERRADVAAWIAASGMVFTLGFLIAGGYR